MFKNELHHCDTTRQITNAHFLILRVSNFTFGLQAENNHQCVQAPVDCIGTLAPSLLPKSPSVALSKVAISLKLSKPLFCIAEHNENVLPEFALLLLCTILCFQYRIGIDKSEDVKKKKTIPIYSV